jgi:phenylacetate-CoA ligase
VQATELAAFFWNVSLIREHLWHRRDFAAKLVAIRNLRHGAGAYPDGHVNPGWNKLLDATFGSSPMPVLRVDTPMAEQAEWLVRQNPDYLLTFPSNAEALARHCIAHDIDVPRLREVRCFGEVLGPRAAQVCRDAWDAKVTDVYSSEELGYIAPQCPEAGRYHVQSELVLVEVLDEEGQACAPGRVGEVVATRLHNFATPLVRYALGDYAEVGSPCACGRGLPVLNRIMGRTRNMLRLPDGGRLWPSFGDAGYAEIAPISQFQFAQTAPERIEMRVVAARALTAAEETALARLVRDRLRRPFEIVVRRCDAIPRDAGNKYEDFRCELPGS